MASVELNEHQYEQAKRLLGAIEALEADTAVTQTPIMHEQQIIRQALVSLGKAKYELKVMTAHYEMDHRPARKPRTDGNTLEKVFEPAPVAKPKMEKPKMRRRDTAYPYIRAWGHFQHSYAWYITDQVTLAQKESAPLTAVYRKTDGSWAIVEELPYDVRFTINKWLDEEETL